MQIPYDKLYELYLDVDLEKYKLKKENKKLKEELNCALFGDRRTKQYKELMGISKKELHYQNKEVTRLNNIISELEEFLNKVVETGLGIEPITCKNILNYLQELKENK